VQEGAGNPDPVEGALVLLLQPQRPRASCILVAEACWHTRPFLHALVLSLKWSPDHKRTEKHTFELKSAFE
jgi:hypothetical protein